MHLQTLRAVALATIVLVSRASAQEISYSSLIKPFLARKCAACHQAQVKQSDLIVTSYADLKKGGRKGPAWVAGEPDGSVLIQYLTGKMEPRMPMGGQPLANSEIEMFRHWIAAGAPDDSATASRAVPVARKPTVYSKAPLVTAIAVSPDGRTLAVSGYHEILLTSLDGKLQGRLPGASMRIHSISFTPDGKTLVAVGGDPARMGEVQIWDVAARKLRQAIEASTDTLFGGSISPDGKLLACGAADKAIRLFDIESGKEIRKMEHHEDWVFQTVFGLDGKRIVTVGRDRAAKLIDVESGRFIENVNLLRDSLTAVARHPKKDWVAIGGAERIPYLYKMDRPRAMRIADDSTLIRKFDRQDGPILALAISPDGSRLAVGAESGAVRIYDTETGTETAKCTGHEGGVYALAFAPDGTLIAGGFDGKLRFYDGKGTLAAAFVAAPIEVARQ
ncbi:MAG: c-type cytochrome domain-containing protein [Bryobacteraceae bacterium]